MDRLPKYLHNTQGTLWLTEEEKENLSINYRVKNVLYAENSQFQHVMVLDSYDFGTMLVLDGAVQTTSMDGFIYNEMIAHVPCTIHPNPKRVLIIGGGDGGAAQEAAKYDSVERIDLVEIDEAVVKVCQQFMPEVSGGTKTDPRIHFHYADGVEFVKHRQNEYDVIIVDSSDPVGPAIQLFESSFYQNLYNALREDGLMVCQSQSPIFHQDIMSKSYTRIGSIFPYHSMYTAVVPTYPGGLWSFTIGSKQKLPDLASIRFDKDTKYVNERIIQGSFALPEFLHQLLHKAAN